MQNNKLSEIKCSNVRVEQSPHIVEIAERVHITSAIRAVHLVISNVQISVSRFLSAVIHRIIMQ